MNGHSLRHPRLRRLLPLAGKLLSPIFVWGVLIAWVQVSVMYQAILVVAG
ncbi:MAG: hypothetical protein AB1640_10305 [bacterium]